MQALCGPTEGNRGPAELLEALHTMLSFCPPPNLSVASRVLKEGLSTALTIQEIVWKE